MTEVTHAIQTGAIETIGQFQILPSETLKEMFIIWDDNAGDVLKNKDGVVYFDSVESARARCNGEVAVPAKTKKEAVVRAPKGESALGLMRKLIAENVLTDAEIFERVNAIKSGYRHVSIVSYTRKKMAAK